MIVDMIFHVEHIEINDSQESMIKKKIKTTCFQ